MSDQTRSIRLLLAEDDANSADMLSRRLEHHGFSVRVVRDGESVLEEARRELPDLVLMDMTLPVKDGWTATRELKADLALSSVPVIAITANSLTSDRARAYDAGCDDFHSKPVDFAALRKQIARLLGDRAPVSCHSIDTGLSKG